MKEDALALATQHTGTGLSREKACILAQSKASMGGQTAGECACKIRGNNIHVCDSASTKPGARIASTPPLTLESRPQPPKVQPRPAQCGTMVKYRDTKLADDLNEAIKHYSAASKSLELLTPIKQQSIRLQKGQPLFNDAYKLMLSLKTAATAIGDIMGLLPGTGMAVKTATGFAGKILSSQAELSVSVLTGEVDSWVATEALGLVPGLGAGLKAAYNFGENLNALKDADEEGRAILIGINQHVSGLERLIRKQDELLKANNFYLKMLNLVKNDIDAMCR